ncbi:MAG: AAA family ATPase [Gemmatimonadota bacterium]|nr:AAA family ATPase [Gemmatimonadota bacterium]
MKELFDWVQWFGELADKVQEGGPEGLAAKAQEVHWADGRCAVLESGPENADPLTFFYHLARISKENRRETTYASVADVFGIESRLDYSAGHCFIFPAPPGFRVRFTGTGADPRLLWRMFHQARDPDAAATSEAAIADTFAEMLRINGVGVAMLTQSLFLINPWAFLPFDENAVVPLGIGGVDKTLLDKSLSWTRYLDAMGKVRATFPGCECYEINIISYLWTSDDLAREGNRWYRIGVSSEDEWRDFRRNNRIRCTGLGDGTPGSATDQLAGEPQPGDVVLVHSGRQEGRAIGIVDYYYHKKVKESAQTQTATKAIKKAGTVALPQVRCGPTNGRFRVQVSLDEGASWSTCLIMSRNDADAIPTYNPEWSDGEAIHKVANDALAAMRRRLADKGEERFRSAKFAKQALKPAIRRAMMPRGDNPPVYVPSRTDVPGEIDDRKPTTHPDDTLHILWVNKSRAPLAGTVDGGQPTGVLSSVDQATYQAFASSPAYSLTMDLLKPPPPPPSPTTHPVNQILYGPPGTGKTYHAVTCAMAIVKGIEADEVTEEHRTEFRSLRFDPTTDTGQIAMVTFHQNFSYEDFVEGIRPRLAEDGDLGYELRHGLFRRIADAARADPHHRPYVLIIDEINRGNVPKVLGELITLIEPSRRIGQQDETTVTLPYSGDTFGVPGNLHIIGTMNTADRSILPLDTALRRRFDHVERSPEPDHPLIADRIAGIDLRKMLKAINVRISLLMDRERQIGHTYLFNVTDIESLAAKFRTAMLPLLAEYFYDDWSKIRHVLGGAPFVVAKPPGDYGSGLEQEGLLDPDTAIHEVLPATAEEWLDPVQYRRIYDESVSSGGDQPGDESPDIGDGQS